MVCRSVQIHQEADARMGLDEQEMYWGKCLSRIKGKGKESRPGQSLDQCGSDTCERRKERKRQLQDND